MAYQVSNGSSIPHATDYKNLLTLLKAFAESNGWTTLRWNVTTELEWIAVGPGLSGYEKVYIGVSTYSYASNQAYCWQMGVFTGYDPSAAFYSQPNAMIKAVALWQSTIQYWFIVNGQRILLATNINGIDQLGYMGKFFTYNTPEQYPNPLLIAGPLASVAYVPYNDLSVKGAFIDGSPTALLRDNSKPNLTLWPMNLTNVWSEERMGSNLILPAVEAISTTNSLVPLFPVCVASPSVALPTFQNTTYSGTYNRLNYSEIPPTLNLFGDLDGVYFCPNLFEDPLRSQHPSVQVSGIDHILFSNGPTYAALRLS